MGKSFFTVLLSFSQFGSSVIFSCSGLKHLKTKALGAYVCMCVAHPWCVYMKSEDSFVESLLSFHLCMGPRDWTQAARYVGKAPFTHRAPSPSQLKWLWVSCILTIQKLHISLFPQQAPHSLISCSLVIKCIDRPSYSKNEVSYYLR